jgi:hypothetical protein
MSSLLAYIHVAGTGPMEILLSGFRVYRLSGGK